MVLLSVRGWYRCHCRTDVQVADFIQDHCTCCSKHFYEMLLPLQPLKCSPAPEEVGATAAEVLLSLPQELAESMLRSNGATSMLIQWVHVLPPSYLPVVFGAALATYQCHLYVPQHCTKNKLACEQDPAEKLALAVGTSAVTGAVTTCRQ